MGITTKRGVNGPICANDGGAVSESWVTIGGPCEGDLAGVAQRERRGYHLGGRGIDTASRSSPSAGPPVAAQHFDKDRLFWHIVHPAQRSMQFGPRSSRGSLGWRHVPRSPTPAIPSGSRHRLRICSSMTTCGCQRRLQIRRAHRSPHHSRGRRITPPWRRWTRVAWFRASPRV